MSIQILFHPFCCYMRKGFSKFLILQFPSFKHCVTKILENYPRNIGYHTNTSLSTTKLRLNQPVLHIQSRRECKQPKDDNRLPFITCRNRLWRERSSFFFVFLLFHRPRLMIYGTFFIFLQLLLFQYLLYSSSWNTTVSLPRDILFVWCVKTYIWISPCKKKKVWI